MPAFLAEADGDAALMQGEIGGVEIGVEQVLGLPRESGQQGVPGESAGGFRAQLQLEFDFGAHPSLPVGGVWLMGGVRRRRRKRSPGRAGS